ncbi:hypothetical protein [Amycolatopsis sp.]|jgi:hypothetical protein|uniref:hypothetical protein n=1 Tax=Amycolatopsis sp. TaxID=37632 RepID=UPI002DFA98D6|nr:hypothetical protein [Amycolatopsis sp.]
MTAALRLPDAFTPGRTSAAAATPTCCCCCCAISAVSASVVLPAVFMEDVRQQRPTGLSRDRRDGVALLLAALPWLLLILPFVLPSSTTDRLFAAGGQRIVLAVVVTTVLTAILAALGGSRTPWHTAGYFVLWAGIAVVESLLVLATLHVYGLFFFTVPVYLFLLFRLPRKIHERIGPK